MTRALRTLVVLSVLAATSTAFAGTAQAATAFDGKRCTIVGTARADIIHGTAGNDVICGLGGDDHLYGMGGNDVLDGGYGWDWLWGGSGTDVMSGGPDYDTVWYDDHAKGVRAVMDGKPDSGTGAEHDTIGGTVENVVGSDHDDTIIGNPHTSNILVGGPGNDLFSSPESSDNRQRGDEVYGDGGVDEITYAWVTSANRVVSVSIDDRTGDGVSGFVRDNVHTDVEIVRGGPSNDRLVGNKYSNELLGGPGDDVLVGLGGPDYLYGESGRDTVSYGDKTSGLSVTMNALDDDGTPGEKDYVDPSVEALTLGAGNDSFHGGTLPMTVDGGAGNDILLGGSGGDTLRGGGGNDHLEGNGGDDAVTGDGGDDVLGGGDGRDVLNGAAGDDKLTGGPGNDRLHGAQGSDTMDGGEGTNVCDRDGTDAYTSCQLVANVIDSASVITGHLLDSHGDPVPGASVTGAGITTTTTADGSFAAPFGSDGRFDVTVPPTSTAPAEVFRSTQAFTGDSDDVTLTLPGTSPATVHVTDQHGDPVAGAAVDLSGTPYPNIAAGPQVVAMADSTLNPSLSPFQSSLVLEPADRSTGADGLVAFPVIGTEIPFLRVVRNDPHAGLVSSGLETQVAFGPVPLERSLDLTSAHLVVTLRDRLGSPLSGISFANQNPYYGSATSDGDGRVVLDVPKRADSWTIGTSGAPLVGTIDLTGGDRTLTLTLPQGNRAVHLQGTDGQSLGGATVYETPGNVSVSVSPDLPSFSTSQPYCYYCVTTATADSSGDVAIPALGIASIRVVAQGPVSGTRSLNQAWTAGTEPETISLDTRDGVVAGTISDGAGRAFAGAKVEGNVYGTQADPTDSYDSDVTTADGAFAVHGIPATTKLSVSGTLVPGLPRTFQFAPTDVSPRQDLAIALHPVPLVVHVQDVSGKPVGSSFILRAAGTMTSSFWPGGPDVAGQWGVDLHGTDATGTVTDTVLPGKASTIQVYGGGHFGMVSDVAISATGATVTVKLSY